MNKALSYNNSKGKSAFKDNRPHFLVQKKLKNTLEKGRTHQMAIQGIFSQNSQQPIQRVGGAAVGYDGDTITKSPFKSATKELFEVARAINKIRKKVIEAKNTTELSSLPENQKGRQVKNIYAGELIGAELSVDFLKAVATNSGNARAWLAEGFREKVILKDEYDELDGKIKGFANTIEIDEANEKIIDKTWKSTDGGSDFTKILIGKDAFKLVSAKDESTGNFRDIYTKMGKEGSEYVKDDFGNFVRRFAYMEKSYHQWMAFKEQGFLTGKTEDLAGAATDKPALGVDPTDFENQKLTKDEQAIFKKYVTDKDKGDPAENKKNRLIALAFMHQWKGSGPGQRGLSLTATPKENAVFGNRGESFRSDTGAKFKVDLSKINPADNVLINHYSSDSPTRDALIGGDKASRDGKLGGEAGGKGSKYHYQYERSVIKNREIFLKKLTPEAVTEINPHESGVDVDRESATYIYWKNAAIANFQHQQSINTLEDIKARVHNDYLRADGNVNFIYSELGRLNGNLTYYQNEYGKEKIRESLNRDKTETKKSETGQSTTEKRDSKFWEQAIVNIQRGIAQANWDYTNALMARDSFATEINNCLFWISQHRRSIVIAPTGVNKHSEAGWNAGKQFLEGLADGAKEKIITGRSEKEKIELLFGKAYSEKDKYTPYWQGFGKGMQ